MKSPVRSRSPTSSSSRSPASSRSRSPERSRSPRSSRRQPSHSRSRSPARSRSPRSSRGQPSHSRFQDHMSSRSRSPRSSRGQPSHSRFQDQPKYRPRFVEREGRKGREGREDRAQSPRRSLDGSRNRDTVFQSIESREENNRSRDRLPENPKIQGDASRKTAEQIQMEKVMGFSGFQETRDQYFD